MVRGHSYYFLADVVPPLAVGTGSEQNFLSLAEHVSYFTRSAKSASERPSPWAGNGLPKWSDIGKAEDRRM
jgi:hypothetical protein